MVAETRKQKDVPIEHITATPGTTRVWNNPSVPLAAAVAPDSLYLLACAAGAVLLLLFLIARLRLHPALSLIVAALTLGIAAGMPLHQVPLSFTAGVGGLMGHIAIILGLGAILGRLLASSGGATALGGALVENCGEKGLPWALLGLGILVGMPVFFEVGLVLMMPIIAAAAHRSGRPPILVGIPLLAGLSIVHGTLPPHPAAMLAVVQYHADMGRTILLGLLVGLPAGIVAGPVLGWYLMRRWSKQAAKGGIKPAYEEPALFEEAEIAAEQNALAATEPASAPSPQSHPNAAPANPVPVGPIRAATAILLPIALIFLGSWADSLAPAGSPANQILRFIGSPDIALLIAVLVALVTLGGHIQTDSAHAGKKDRQGLLRKLTAESFEPIANVLVILAAAGGLSGVLRDSGSCTGHGHPGPGRAHAAARARLASGRRGPRLHGIGHRVHGGCVRSAGAHGWPHRRAPRTAGACHRHRLPDFFAGQRSRLLDDPVLFQTRNQGNLRHVDSSGDGAFGDRFGGHAPFVGSAALSLLFSPASRP